MNFTDLYKKIVELEKPLEECAECGEHPPAPEQPKQQDSVNMNVTMSGQGANGIRDLLDILKNIEEVEPTHEPKHHGDIIIGEPGGIDQSLDDSYGNSIEGGSDANVYGIDAINFTGDDLHSKGAEAPKQAGGGNPWNVSEELVSQLKSLYQEVKDRPINENRDLPGYGDEATWGTDGDYPTKKPVHRRSAPAEFEPSHNIKPKQEQRTPVKWDNSKEGHAPNGEKYNTRVLVKGKSKSDIEHEVHLINKHEWGAKKIVDVVIKQTDDNDFPYAGMIFVVDNHRYGMWQPWKDQEPISKPLSFK